MFKQELLKLFLPINEEGNIDYNLWIIPKFKAVKGLLAPYMPFIITGIIAVASVYYLSKGIIKFFPWLYIKIFKKEKTISYQESEEVVSDFVDRQYGFSYPTYSKD